MYIFVTIFTTTKGLKQKTISMCRLYKFNSLQLKIEEDEELDISQYICCDVLHIKPTHKFAHKDSPYADK